uniref:Profilin n=1 Tax=Monopterus albus TaxID=43700 RepID=A0A3Q3IQE8_MONAL|nr:profilin-2-like [Monopterus albus]
MSWKPYVDNLMAPDQSGNRVVAQAAICGCLPGQEAVWASSEGFACILEAEIKRLAGDRKDFGQCGPTIANRKCRLIRDNLSTEGLYTMDLKTGADAEGNTYNVCVGRSNQVIAIIMGTKDANGGQLSEKMNKLVVYLRAAGM